MGRLARAHCLVRELLRERPMPQDDAMGSSSPKSAIDIQGLAYDWLGCDGDGRVALLRTAGDGHAPAELLRVTTNWLGALVRRRLPWAARRSRRGGFREKERLR